MYMVILGIIVLGSLAFGWFLYSKFDPKIQVVDDMSMADIHKDPDKTKKKRVKKDKPVNDYNSMLANKGYPAQNADIRDDLKYVDASVKNAQGKRVGFNVFLAPMKSGKVFIRVPTTVAGYDFYFKKSQLKKEISSKASVNHFKNGTLGLRDGENGNFAQEAGYALDFEDGDLILTFERTNSNPELKVTVSAKRLLSQM